MSNKYRRQAAHEVRRRRSGRPLKVILLNDDYTPREFVALALKAVLGRMNVDPRPTGDDRRAPARRLRHRGLRPGRRRDQGQEATEPGQVEGLSASTTEPEE